METTIQSRLLSDGSEVFNIVFVDGSDKVIISCTGEKPALQLQKAFKEFALDGRVEK